MKTLSISIGFLMMLYLFVNISASIAEEISGPRLVIERTEFEHVAVERGEIVEHSFQVQNQGDETLEIKKVVPG